MPSCARGRDPSPRERVPPGWRPRAGACARRSRRGRRRRAAAHGRSPSPPCRRAARLGRAARVVVRLGAVREGVHRRADRHSERKVEGQLGVVDRRDRRGAARPSRRPSARLEQHPEERRPLGAGVGRRDGDDPRQRLRAVLGERGDDRLAGVDRRCHHRGRRDRPPAGSERARAASRTVSTGTCDRTPS